MRRFCWSCEIIFFHRPVPQTERFRSLPSALPTRLHSCRQEAFPMKKNISIHLAMLVLAFSIVLPVDASVKHLSSNGASAISPAVESGSPLPAPPPPGYSVASLSGSPLPAPPPPGFPFLSASGSPLPAPPPPGYSASLSGSPLPAPPPPSQMA